MYNLSPVESKLMSKYGLKRSDINEDAKDYSNVLTEKAHDRLVRSFLDELKGINFALPDKNGELWLTYDGWVARRLIFKAGDNPSRLIYERYTGIPLVLAAIDSAWRYALDAYGDEQGVWVHEDNNNVYLESIAFKPGDTAILQDTIEFNDLDQYHSQWADSPQYETYIVRRGTEVKITDALFNGDFDIETVGPSGELIDVSDLSYSYIVPRDRQNFDK